MIFEKMFWRYSKNLKMYLRQSWGISVTFFKENLRIICENIIGNSSDNLRKNSSKTEKSPGNY